MESISQRIENLKIAVDEKSDTKGILDLLSSIHSDIDGTDKDVGCSGSEMVTQLVTLLTRWDNEDVLAKAAMTVSALAKSETGRNACCTPSLVNPLLLLLSKRSSDLQVLIQVCRALGNICYENNEGRKYVLEGDGLQLLLNVIEYGLSKGEDTSARQLQSCSAGFLLNLIMGQEELYPKVVEMGVMDLLCSILELGISTKEGEEAGIHVLIILGLLTDSAPGSLLLSERLCGVTVKTLETSTSGELSELCVELLHTQAENEIVRLHLAKAGLCELLIQLLEKHGTLVEDDETRNLMKMACDLIIIILNGDESMNLLYADGKGKVFQGMVGWLTSTDDDLQITGVLAMGNFARTDKHCIQMVQLGVSKKLLTLVSKNNTSAADIRLQHALLSALRNLVIPGPNKATVLSDGLLEAVFPMLSVPTFPVVFKLLGTLRMVIDGQEAAARTLGCNKELISKLVEWCGTEDHPGVQGEAYRLLAWLIKNSRDREVMGCMVSTKAVTQLVAMITAEHAVMQAEALLALSILTSMRLSDAEPYLLEAKVGERIVALIDPSIEREVFLNLLAFIGQLATSGDMKLHLREKGVPKTLSTIVQLKDNLTDMRDQVSRLTSMLDSG